MLIEHNHVGPSVADRATRAASSPAAPGSDVAAVGYGTYGRSAAISPHPYLAIGHPNVGPGGNDN